MARDSEDLLALLTSAFDMPELQAGDRVTPIGGLMAEFDADRHATLLVFQAWVIDALSDDHLPATERWMVSFLAAIRIGRQLQREDDRDH